MWIMVKSGNKFTFTTIDPNFDGLGVGKCSKPGLHSFLLICHIQYVIYCIKSTVKFFALDLDFGFPVPSRDATFERQSVVCCH